MYQCGPIVAGCRVPPAYCPPTPWYSVSFFFILAPHPASVISYISQARPLLAPPRLCLFGSFLLLSPLFHPSQQKGHPPCQPTTHLQSPSPTHTRSLSPSHLHTSIHCIHSLTAPATHQPTTYTTHSPTHALRTRHNKPPPGPAPPFNSLLVSFFFLNPLLPLQISPSACRSTTIQSPPHTHTMASTFLPFNPQPMASSSGAKPKRKRASSLEAEESNAKVSQKKT